MRRRNLFERRPDVESENAPAWAIHDVIFVMTHRRENVDSQQKNARARALVPAKTKAAQQQPKRLWTMFFGGDPFAGMHGHGHGGRRSARSRDTDTTKLYETLGVRKMMEKKFVSVLARLTTMTRANYSLLLLSFSLL